MTTYIGIDNGISGAVAAITDSGLRYAKMPIVKEYGRNWVDAAALQTLLLEMTDYDGEVFVVYERPGGSKNAKAAKSMEASFAAVDCVLKLNDMPREAITSVKWQRTWWAKVEDTKAEALRVARGIWPAQTFLATERSKVPHDGIVDAALIAEWGRRTFG